MDPASTVLVTGASGFLGRHLLRRLLEAGSSVVAVSRNPEQLDDLKHPRMSVVRADFERAIPEIDRGAVVIHLSALRLSSRESRERYLAVNHAATVRLAQRALASGAIRFINVSTAMVLGASSAAPVDEDQPFSAAVRANAYIGSKVAALEDLERMVVDGLPLVTLLPSIVYGPDHPSRPNLITNHMRRILASPFRIHVGDSRRERSLAFVDDVVGALISSVDAEVPPGARFLLGGEDVSMRGFEELVLELSGRRRTAVVTVPVSLAGAVARSADIVGRRSVGEGFAAQLSNLQKEWKFDSKRADQFLGYVRTPLREGVRKTLECLKTFRR